MKLSHFSPLGLVLAAGLAFSTAPAAATSFTYRGELSKDGQVFDGTAQFKFVICKGGETLWSSGGKTDSCGEPDKGIDVTVEDGAFAVSIRGSTLNGLNGEASANLDGASLHVWIDAGGGFTELPEQELSMSSDGEGVVRVENTAGDLVSWNQASQERSLLSVSAEGEIDTTQDYNARFKRALEANPKLEYDPGTVLVRFDPKLPQMPEEQLKKVSGATVVETFKTVPGLVLVEVDGPADEAVKQLAKVPGVLYAEHNYVVRSTATPNDPMLGSEWGLRNTGQTVNGDPGTLNADIRASKAWDITTGVASLAIADIDSGVNMSHPDLAANIWTNAGEISGNGIDDDNNGYVDDVRGWNFVSSNNNPTDDRGHGTHTAGTFGAVGNNGVGITGVAWRCKIVPLKFLDAQGFGSSSNAIRAIEYCTRNRIKISNNSWGGGFYSQAMADAIAATRSVGHVFVAAAGNSRLNIDANPMYPAAYNLDNIISVAATDNDDGLASFSNIGFNSVDIAAPGVNVLSTYGSGYAYISGTSMAAPHVTGVVALVYGQNPTWTYSQVRGRVLSTARPVPSMAGKCVTGGVVNAFAAVSGGVPSAPSGVNATDVWDDTIDLQWNDNSTSETGFHVQALVGGQWRTFDSTSRDDRTIRVTNILGSRITPSTNYQFRVFSYNDSGNSTPSGTFSVRSGPARPSQTRVSSMTNSRADVVWTDNASDENTMMVYWERWNGTSGSSQRSATLSADTRTYRIPNLTPNTRYRAWVRAYRNDDTRSGIWGYTEFTTPR